MSSSLVSWNCEKCTYFHKCHGTRCAMCGALRVTKQQMRDFIAGKTLKKSDEKENEANQNLLQEQTQTEYIPPGTLKSIPVTNPYDKANTARSIANPYTRPSTGQATQQQRAKCSYLPQQHQIQLIRTAITAIDDDNSFHDGSNPPNPHLKAILQSMPQSTASSSSSWPKSSKVQPQRPAPIPPSLFTKPLPKVRIPCQLGPVPLDPTVASNWIYPVHGDFPVRDYQLEISQTAILHNTLVSLPTGLGKTLIAAVVLYNYYRWFPSGKVVFLAPTLPLVHQQIQACYKIMGIPAADTAVLTGKVGAKERTRFWKERRVFFCTPQTVEKDIAGGRCNAAHIVCIVLDEAHKASGNYAYTKVVEQTEASGAKFRILGLSATPGGEIKAIQKVVDALRISKIEARMEDDLSVKKYIHERHNEIVVVQQGSAVTTIERLLNNVIAPLLDRLRSNNGLAMIRGNATLTQYCLIKAKQEYNERTGDHKMDVYFLLAQKLVGIRTDVRRVGIGVARQKLSRIRDEARSGLMSNVVKSKDFQELMAHVLRSSSNPGDSDEKAEDRKLNNPKLMKLDEILKEHFERSKACGESSRAIVFSQWRDSVSEIVSVLADGEPLLRPRHFVGQGKSAGTNDDKKSLNGMKQKEQQQVMTDFQNGIFNILVCTSIGEEGLDIGEVDLIVNFDTLRSPIRMIQRVGRTGRKRNGRVVCLVSEGAEQKTMVASKQAERTLGRALRKPDAFTFVPSLPMFQQDPVLVKNDMSITAKLQLSQVGGHLANGAGREKLDLIEKPANFVEKEWKLTEDEEMKRSAILGPISSILCESFHTKLPDSLRRQLLRGRDRSFVRHSASQSQSNKMKRMGSSVISKILISIENAHGNPIKSNVVMQSSKFRKSRIGLSEASILNNLFPVQKNEAKVASIQQVWTQPPVAETYASEAEEENVLGVWGESQQQPAAAVATPEKFETDAPMPTIAPVSAHLSRVGVALVQSQAVPDARVGPFMRLPTPEPSSASDSEVDEETRKPDPVDSGVAVSSISMAIGRTVVLPSLTPQVIPERIQSQSPPRSLDMEANPSTKPVRLPTPDPSSASEDGSDAECYNMSSSATRILGAVTTPAKSWPLKQHDNAPNVTGFVADEVRSFLSSNINMRQDLDESPQEDALPGYFRLPTQDSSSDDESALEEEENDNASLSEKQRQKERHASPVDKIGADSRGRLPNILNIDKTVLDYESPKDFSKSPDIATGRASPKLQFIEKLRTLATTHVDSECEFKGGSQESVALVVGTISTENVSLTTKEKDGLLDAPVNKETPEIQDDESQRSVVRPSKSYRSNIFLSQASPLAARDATASIRAGIIDLIDTPLSLQSSGMTYSPQNAVHSDPVDKPSSKAPVVLSCKSFRSKVFLSQDTPLAAKVGASFGANADLVDGLTDSPQTGCMNALVDTPATLNEDLDVVCSVCNRGEVTDSDPIVLCDGPGGDETCDLAVHASCYFIKTPLDDTDEWRCDRCEHQHGVPRTTSVKTIDVFCGICQRAEGALKLVSSEAGDKWLHPYCQTWGVSISSKSTCGICRWSGAVTCHSESCRLSVHPHCGLNAKSKPWRMLVCQDTKLTLAFCNDHSKEANDILDQMGHRAVNDSVKCIMLPSSRYRKKLNLLVTKRDAEDNKPTRRRLAKKTRFSIDDDEKIEAKREQADSPEETRSAKKARIRERLRQRHRDMLRSGLIDAEAGIDSDEDPDGDDAEEDDIRRMEEEEFNSSFINDSSQLGEYTQDELDLADLDEDDDNIHRRLDSEDIIKKQFATPILNRRMVKNRDCLETQESSGETLTSDSQHGLGNMHFIRSVLEHHRNGGDADDIERMYHDIGREVAAEDENEQDDESQAIARYPRVDQYVPSDEEGLGDRHSSSSRPARHSHPQVSSSIVVCDLTAKQKALIEQKRQEAIAKQRLQAR